MTRADEDGEHRAPVHRGLEVDQVPVSPAELASGLDGRQLRLVVGNAAGDRRGLSTRGPP